MVRSLNRDYRQYNIIGEKETNKDREEEREKERGEREKTREREKLRGKKNYKNSEIETRNCRDSFIK